MTLEVTPDQAEKLDVARSVGTLSLVLRNQVDTAAVSTGGATKLTLLKMPAVEPAAKPATVVIQRPAPVRTVVAAPVHRNCIGVLAGIQGSLECF